MGSRSRGRRQPRRAGPSFADPAQDLARREVDRDARAVEGDEVGEALEQPGRHRGEGGVRGDVGGLVAHHHLRAAILEPAEDVRVHEHPHRSTRGEGAVGASSSRRRCCRTAPAAHRAPRRARRACRAPRPATGPFQSGSTRETCRTARVTRPRVAARLHGRHGQQRPRGAYDGEAVGQPQRGALAGTTEGGDPHVVVGRHEGDAGLRSGPVTRRTRRSGRPARRCRSRRPGRARPAASSASGAASSTYRSDRSPTRRAAALS